jgi:hypothetical protein
MLLAHACTPACSLQALPAPGLRALSGVLLRGVGRQRDDRQPHRTRARRRLPRTPRGSGFRPAHDGHRHVKHGKVEGRRGGRHAGGGGGSDGVIVCTKRVERRAAVRHGGHVEVLQLQKSCEEPEVELEDTTQHLSLQPASRQHAARTHDPRLAMYRTHRMIVLVKRRRSHAARASARDSDDATPTTSARTATRTWNLKRRTRDVALRGRFSPGCGVAMVAAAAAAAAASRSAS